MPPRVNRPAVLAALVLGLFWCVEGIDVNAPQLDRVVLLLAGLGLAWAALRDTPFVAGCNAYYGVLVMKGEDLRSRNHVRQHDPHITAALAKEGASR